MERGLSPGAVHSLNVVVAPEMAAPHLGPAGAVLSTPSMIGLIEQCCRQAMAGTLGDDELAVGAGVCISHDAACRVGDEVAVRAVLARREGRRHVWEVAVKTADGRRVGGGTLDIEVRGRAAPAS